MSKKSTQSLSQKKTMPSKLVMGLLVAAVSVFVGTAGVAGATSHGDGYGGDVNGGVNIDLSGFVGDNNVIVIIINYFAGK